MQEKRIQIEEFFSHYHKLTQQEDVLLNIQNALQQKKEVGFDANLTIQGKTFSLHELAGESPESVFQSFEEDLSLFILYLLKVNQGKLTDLLDSISFKTESDTISPSDKVEIKEEKKVDKQQETLSPSQVMDVVIEQIEQVEKGMIINPSTLYDHLDGNLQERITLSDIHDILRDYVDQDKMQIIHNATCYKCNVGYEQDYEKLPRDVTCGHCGADIVNIEIRYKKL